jgi:protein phosphatase
MSDIVTDDGVVIDCFGATDPGKRRDTNEDHFVIAGVRKGVDLYRTSLSTAAVAHRVGSVTAHLFAVADGVGGRPLGDMASERAVAAILAYVGQVAACFQAFNPVSEHGLLTRLEETVLAVHRELLDEHGGAKQMAPATTLTMLLLVWPRAYLVHVGDSRAYVKRRQRVQRLTQDQTLGEYMVAAGAWTEEQAAHVPAAQTLSSAVGGVDITPVVGLVDLEAGDGLLLCTDGLTKHVDDARIAELLNGSGSAESIARQLIDDALAAGGSDNVTVVVVRTEPPG